jgi:hypothetical protein
VVHFHLTVRAVTMSDSMHDEAPTIIPDATEVFEPAEVPAGGDEAPEETVDGVPVLAEARPLEPVGPAGLPAAQAVAVAATGFVAGAATIALVKRHSARKLARRSATRRAVDLLPIVGTRTFLVDVHLIAKPQE